MDFMIYWDNGSPLCLPFFGYETLSQIFEQDVKTLRCCICQICCTQINSLLFCAMIWKMQMILLMLNLLVMDYRPPGKKKMFKNQISWHQ